MNIPCPTRPIRCFRSPVQAALTAVILLACTLGHAQPADFFIRDGNFQDAVKRATQEGKPLLVSVSVEWAQSERQMRRSTWQDRSITDLIESRTIPVYFDADENENAAERFNALAYPTLVLVNPNGQTLGRPLVGFRTVDQVRAWIRATLGESQTDTSTDANAPSARNVPATLFTALQREQAGQDDLALDFLDWLWLNLSQLNPTTSAARRTFLTEPMARLAQRSEPANDRFIELRDNAESRLISGTYDWADLRDWIALNAVTNTPNRSIEWAHERLETPEGLNLVRRLEAELLPIALQARDTGLIRVLCPDPPESALRLMRRLASIQGSGLQALDDTLLEYRDDQLAQFYAAMLDLGLDDQADETARTILVRSGARTDELRLRMIEASIDWGQPRTIHRNWIDRIGTGTDESRVAQVSQALENALKGNTP